MGAMPSAAAHVERHLSHRSNWLRAAVLGANDGITSTAALIVGVAAADASRAAVFTAGMAALVAGAGSMAAGEYTSVSSQRDTELADIAKERDELATMPERELHELTRIYVDKGLSHDLAEQVATELSKGDVLAVHMAEELGITHDTLAQPDAGRALLGGVVRRRGRGSAPGGHAGGLDHRAGGGRPSWSRWWRSPRSARRGPAPAGPGSAVPRCACWCSAGWPWP